ncbi:hypothetical protein ARMSODRAFT_1023370 [Armillaria solidipes]|uniref:Uncharacterized protein n=2 Tax=Armillaria TaxID=47424 RepID=A0A2H3BI29_9AGAR|nr:hypothetical protein EV421DRAFT_1822697 [Armillaria borealis]PBK64207.1 hypothetical protein ARMSODRAFT_1023370 [Armillaria solidipes]
MAKLTFKFAALALAVLAPVASAIDIMLCDEAYFNSCTWNYNVPTGECLNTGASAGWNGFHNDAVSSYRQINSGSCGKCYYFANEDCHGQMFNNGDYEQNWLAGNNDKLSSIFCSQGA